MVANEAWPDTSEGIYENLYTSVPTLTHLQNSQAAAEAVTLKISSQGTSLKLS